MQNPINLSEEQIESFQKEVRKFPGTAQAFFSFGTKEGQIKESVGAPSIIEIEQDDISASNMLLITNRSLLIPRKGCYFLSASFIKDSFVGTFDDVYIDVICSNLDSSKPSERVMRVRSGELALPGNGRTGRATATRSGIFEFDQQDAIYLTVSSDLEKKRAIRDLSFTIFGI